jgi:HEAT repeat protein
MARAVSERRGGERMPPEERVVAGAVVLLLAIVAFDLVLRDRLGFVSRPSAVAERPAPSSPPEPAALAVPRPAVTPAPARPAETPLRELVEPDLPIQRALDSRADLALRVDAVRELARRGTDEAMEALRRLFASDARSILKAVAAEALGETNHPEAERMLEELLGTDDEIVLRGALRGIAKSGRPGSLGVLEVFLLNPAAPESVRVEAALALGRRGDPAAYRALTLAFVEVESDQMAGRVLEALGALPFSQVEGFFRRMLADPTLSDELKLEALEALGNSTPEAAKLLLEYADRAPDPGLRAGAVNAVSMLDEAEDVQVSLLPLLATESSPAVRAELYSALAFDGSGTYRNTRPEVVVQRILAEREPRARLEGFRLVASMLRAHPDPRLAEPFDRQMVPWLRDQAQSGLQRYTRRVSVDTLRLANTAASTGALRELARSPDRDTASAAQNALLSLQRSIE